MIPMVKQNGTSYLLINLNEMKPLNLQNKLQKLQAY